MEEIGKIYQIHGFNLTRIGTLVDDLSTEGWSLARQSRDGLDYVIWEGQQTPENPKPKLSGKIKGMEVIAYNSDRKLQEFLANYKA